MNKLIFVLLGLLVLTVSVSACVNLSDDTTYQDKVVNLSGVYYINDDVTLCTDTYTTTDTLLVMNASSISLDCNNSVLSGDGGVDDYGIDTNSKDYLTITNCFAQNFAASFHVHSSSNSNFINNTAYNSIWDGFELSFGSNNNLTNNTAYNNNFGFNLFCSDSNTLTNNIAYSNTGGFLIHSSNSNTLTSNTAYSNSVDGFLIHSSNSNNLISNTAYSNSVDGFLLHSSNSNTLTSNTAYSNSGNGFVLHFNSNSNTLTNNILYGNAKSFPYYEIYLPFNSNDNLFYNTIIYTNKTGFTTTRYVHHETTANPANKFINLSICYNETTGCVAWDSLSLSNSTLNSSNFIATPTFISIDDSSVPEFNKPANITVSKNVFCSGINYFKKTGFPSSWNDIVLNGQLFTPTYSSCSDTTNTVRFGVSSFSGYATNPMSCVNFSDPSTYQNRVANINGVFYVNNSIILCTDTYNLQETIKFNKDNLLLDCNGSTLNGSSSGNGIYILNVENTTIKNCTITNYSTGISISHGNATITDSVIHSNLVRGISAYYSDYNYIHNNIIYSNTDGIYFIDSHYSLLEGNTISSNDDYGVRMSSNTKRNRIINNLISENGMWDIEPVLGCSNIIENNVGSGGRPILYIDETTTVDSIEVSQLILCGSDNSIINNVNVTGSDTLKNNGISIRSSDNVYINNTNSSNNYVGLKTSGPLNGLVVENTVLDNNADDGLGAHYDTRDMQTTNIRACGNGGYDINDRFPLTNIYTDATCDNSNPEGICSFTCDAAPVLQPACLDLDDPTTYGTVLSGSYIYGDVILCNKTYSITNGLGVAVNNAVIDCNGSTLTSNGADTFLRIDNHENTELKNCVFEGFEKAVEVNARNTVIENNTFNNVNYAVFSSQISPMQMDLTIRNNTFTNSEKTLYLFRLKGLTVENNAFTNLNGDIPPQILQCEDVVISDNLFEDGESTALSIQGVIRGAIENNVFEEYISFLSMSSSQDIKINNNTFNNSSKGYALSFTGIENISVVNNTLSNVYSGFYTFGSSDVSFMDNDLSVKGDLMELDGISELNIFGNTMAKEDEYKSYTADNPILITDSSDVYVENNNIMDFRSYTLVEFSSVDRLHFIDNVIGNIFYESYTHYPTVFFSGQDFVISGNEFFNMEGGVHIGASAVVMADNLIHDVNRDALNIYPNKENIQISDLEIYNANSTALSVGYLIDSNINNVLIYDSWKGVGFTGIQPYTNTKLNNLTMYNNSNYLSFPAGISGLELTNLTIASEATGQTTVLWEDITPAEGYISSEDIIVGTGFASIDSPDVPMLNVQANISIQMACVSPDSILVYKKDGFPQTLADIIENGTLYTPVSKACTSLNTFTFTVAGFSGYGAEQEVMNINAIPSIVRLGDDVLLNVTNNNGDPINASNVTVDLPGGSTIEDLTGIDGILILTTNETGIHTATARKQGYFNAQTTYEVLAPLSIAYSPANPEEDNSITITITSLGNPINDSNVTIEYGGMEVYSALTDVAGQVVYTPSTHGTYTINAVHDGYWNASVTMSVSEDDGGGKKKKDKGNGNSGTPIPPPYIPPAPDVPVENDTIDEDETQGGAEEPVIDPKEEAREAIQDAVDAINKARGEGKDTSKAEALLLDAQQAYVDGDYPTAILLAEQAKDEAEGAEVALEEEEEFNQPGPTAVEDVIETIEEEAPFGGLEICFGAVLMLAVVLSKLLA